MGDQTSPDHSASIAHSDDETRQRLLEAAARLFAEHGFNKVTVRAICEEARTNIAAVNYHFRDKLSLYREVVQMVADIMDRTKSEALDAGEGQSAEEQLRGYIRIFLHRLLDPEANSWMDKLMLRELMDPSPALDLIIEKGIKPSSERLRRVLGRLLDLPFDDWRVVQCALSVQGQCLFYRMSKPVATRWQPGFRYTPEVIDGIAHHIAEFSLAGIRAVAAQKGEVNA
jgi:AcrR family transcriptional regulator